jgi:hypothetical protein
LFGRNLGTQHPEVVIWLGFETVPVRTTLSRRYKTLYPVLQAFIAYLGQWAETLSTEFDSRVLIEDASLFKAHGPVWHQSDRQAQRIPEKLHPWNAGFCCWGIFTSHRGVSFVG